MRFWKRKNRILFLLTAVLILFAAVSVFAEENEAPLTEEEPFADESFFAEDEVIAETGPFADPDELLSQYLENGFFGSGSAQKARSASYNGNKLTGINRPVYDSLKNQVEEIAAGRQTYTKITTQIGESEFTGKRWCAEDLGIESLGEIIDGKFYATEEFRQVFSETVGFTPMAIYQAVLRDCPYEMYWADLKYSFSYPYSISRIGGEIYATFKDSVNYSIYVSPDYAVLGEGTGSYTDSSGNVITYDPFNMDPSKSTAVNAAISNAHEIVAGNPYTEDYDTLYYYFNTVCGLSDYNSSAASYYAAGYGDPWQIIYLFDGDPSTKVVCEGYSKGIQYLCEMTGFETGLECLSVTGDLYGRSGNHIGYHMWNIVRMDDGKNYLIDATNRSSLGSAAFLSPYSSGSWETYYWIDENLKYTYDADTTLLIFTEEELTLSDVQYRYPAQITVNKEWTDDGLLLTWMDEQEPEGYAVYKSTDGENYEPVYSVEGMEENAWTDTDITGNTVCYYRIDSYKTGPNGERRSTFAAAAYCNPDGCSLTKAKYTQNGVELFWDGNEMADGYELFRKEEGGEFESIAILEGPLTSYTDFFDFTDGALYEYCVRAYKIVGEETFYSGLSDGKAVCTLTTPTITSLVNKDASIRVNWKAGRADGFVIYRQTSAGTFPAVRNMKTGTATGWNDAKAVAAGTRYGYKMRAYRIVDGVTYYSGYATAVYTYRLDRPETPAAVNKALAITLTWKKDPNASGYMIYRSKDGGSYQAVKNVTDNSTLTWNDTHAMTDGAKYRYKMRAYVKVDEVRYYSPYTDAAVICRLAKPVIAKLSAASYGVSISWNKVNKADGYYIYRSENGGAYSKIRTVSGGSTLTYKDKTATESGTKYRYRVKAYKKADGVYYESAYSAIQTIKK